MNTTLYQPQASNEVRTLETALRSAKRKLAAAQRHVRQFFLESRTDPDTGAWNRAALADRISRWSRRWQPRAIAFIEIDDFKLLNDLEGPAAGNKELTLLATVIDCCVRRSDFFCRWGGEKFVIVFSRISSIRLDARLHMIREEFSRLADSRASLSIGTANWLEGDTFEAVLLQAEYAMRCAQAEGRIWPDSSLR